ncbi:MAG: thioredoxin [Candidatus Omnitrophica bacterium]|nr:thioredoxin [Candidatus Omnitrophota bacterium]
MIKLRFRGEQKTEERIGELALLKLPAILINSERDSLLTPPISETEFIKRLILYGAPHRKELIVELEEEEKKKFELVDSPDSPILLSHKNFDEAVRKYVILVVDFWAQWCAPCLMLAPIIERLAKKYKGKIVFGKLNIEENQEIASRFGIMSIPTLIIFKKGNIMDTLIGVTPESTLEEKFNMYLEKR